MGLFDSRQHLRNFQPDALGALLQKHRDLLRLPVATLQAQLQAKAFDEHESTRIQDDTGFQLQINKDKESTFANLVKDNAEVKQVFEGIFKKEEFYTRAQSTYRESMEAFKGLIKNHPEKYEGLRGELKRIQESARKAIEAQQKIELDRLKRILSEPKFNQTLSSSLNITTNPKKIEEVKEGLIKELEATHANQLAAFDKECANNLSAMDKAVQADMEQVIMAGQLNKFTMQLTDTKKRNEMMHELAEAQEAMRKKLGITVDRNDKTRVLARYSPETQIDPQDLNFIYSSTGKKITHDKQSNVWTLEFSPRILNPSYYIGFPVNQEKPKADLLAMATLVKASGFKGITMTIDFPDEKTQKQRLRQAYEACLEAGFSPAEYDADGKAKTKSIVLTDGKGKEIDPRSIFTGEELQILHEYAKQQRSNLDKIKEIRPPATEVSAQMKAANLAQRNQLRQARGDHAQPINVTEEQQDEQAIDQILAKK